MRQAIGSTWVLQLVIIFMLIFVAFLALSINYTKAFRVKNELVTMIEKYEGVSEGENGSVELLNNYLLYNNYSSMGRCEAGDYGVQNLHEPILEPVNTNERYFYCVRKVDASTGALADRAKYRVRIFFKFSLPVLGDLFTFSVEGTSIAITNSLVDIEVAE